MTASAKTRASRDFVKSLPSNIVQFGSISVTFKGDVCIPLSILTKKMDNGAAVTAWICSFRS